MWIPEFDRTERELSRNIAKCLSEDIRSGRISPGEKLPTLRGLADKLGIAVCTVAKAYEYVEKQGLVSRQVGRGTYVCHIPPRKGLRELAVPSAGGIDLQLNRPVPVELNDLNLTRFDGYSRGEDAGEFLDYGPPGGYIQHKAVLAELVGRRTGKASAGDIVITSGAQHGLFAAVGALLRPGDTLLVESHTYCGIKNIGRMFGLNLVPVAMDEEGLLPKAFAEACQTTSARALYCMPEVQSPTACVLSAGRRSKIAEIAERHSILIIEDDSFGQGAPDAGPLLCGLIPERVVYLSSLSKTVAPGVRVGMLCGPAVFHSDFVSSVQATIWTTPPLMVDTVCRWVVDGRLDTIIARRREAASRRLKVARKIFSEKRIRYVEGQSFLWLSLPPRWTGKRFAERAAAQGIAVTPAETFAVKEEEAQRAVRICFGALCSDEEFASALSTLDSLMKLPSSVGPFVV